MTKVFISRILINIYNINHINFFFAKKSSEAIHRAQRGEKNARGFRKKKKWAIETHFPEFKWIIYDFNNNRSNTQKTISICVSQMTVFVNLFQNLGSGYMKLLPEFQIKSISAIEKKNEKIKYACISERI